MKVRVKVKCMYDADVPARLVFTQEVLCAVVSYMIISIYTALQARDNMKSVDYCRYLQSFQDCTSHFRVF